MRKAGAPWDPGLPMRPTGFSSGGLRPSSLPSRTGRWIFDSATTHRVEPVKTARVRSQVRIHPTRKAGSKGPGQVRPTGFEPVTSCSGGVVRGGDSGHPAQQIAGIAGNVCNLHRGRRAIPTPARQPAQAQLRAQLRAAVHRGPKPILRSLRGHDGVIRGEGVAVIWCEGMCSRSPRPRRRPPFRLSTQTRR